MIPSLVARELRESVVEYLATTFALSDDEAYHALTEFLLDEEDGIFRGPFLRVRLPFVEAPDDVELGVAWTPPGFRPYAHQVEAWRRLSGRGRVPQPTLITTGTGSGKSEGFLVPIIDHCLWARRHGRQGIKALVLYPMNALVTDQERRIAAMLADPTVAAVGVRGGVWIGDDGSVTNRRDMDATHLVSDPQALMEDPPDILLTNYKMLDRLLTNASRLRLWAANMKPAGAEAGWDQPLAYLVLDEFHSYDGAQGTDVAMLLRRLGHRLGTMTAASPLAGIGCVGTSATLGSAASAAADMCGFATRVFGTRFDAASIVGEQRRTVAEVCSDIDFSMPTPEPEAVAALDARDLDALAEAFTGVFFDDAQDVGDRLVRHHLTASLLRVASDRPRAWRDAVAGVAQQVPAWGAALARHPDAVAEALERFVALVSHARGRTGSGGERPLFSVEVQVWIREVTRLLRSVSDAPRFRWADSPAAIDVDAVLEMPAVYCTSCGRSGWMGIANKAVGQGDAAIERLVHEGETDPYTVSVRARSRTRTMVRAHPDEPDVLWLDSTSGQVHAADTGGRIPVLVGGMTGDDRGETARDEAAKRQQCPSCGTRDAIRFLGSRVTTLAAVGITQMFGSPHVATDERKLLAFTDSVQDASHRAAFFSGRTHRFNLRATMSRALQAKGRVALPDVAEVVLAQADAEERPEDALFSLIPADLLWEQRLGAAWQSPGTTAANEARAGLAQRLTFEAALEAGLRSRFGRTLETTGTAAAEVIVTEEEWARVIAFAIEAVQANAGTLVTEPDMITAWADGILARLRLRGGIFHPFLDRYVTDGGKRWWIWGGGDRLAPKFPKGISAPAFLTSVASEEFDAIGGAQTWIAQWTKKALGVDGSAAERCVRDLLHAFVDAGIVDTRPSGKGAAWGLPPQRVEFVDVPANDRGFPPTEVRCDLCAHRHYAAPERVERWVGRPCLRLRCPGRYTISTPIGANYYRRLYRAGRIRRVVAAEHTGLLTRQQRERVESGFKDGGRPDAPNLLTATPTLEMGIDIGDLSAVMLTTVPPTQTNYIQRVGRAGRRTGNAFITTFAEGDPRSLYYLHDPELMIAGEIPAPNCYLDAIEILRRQYLAFLIDRAAEGTAGLIPTAPTMPNTIGQAAAPAGLQPGGWLHEILEAGRQPEMVSRFVRLFGAHLDPAVAARLAMWAATDMRTHVERILERWLAQIKLLTNQRSRLREREQPLAAIANPTSEDEEALGRVLAELRYVAWKINEARREPTLNALEALGLTPNYTLFDDTVALQVSLWRPNDDHDPAASGSARFSATQAEYTRPAAVAIRELAPGHYFYVDAHRVRIDAVDNGTENEPAHAAWRLCPSCSWATTDASAQQAACPRCGSAGVADQGAVLTVLPMRVVSSTERELTARVGDDSEDRDRVFHEVLTTVDVAPEDITAAWLHTSVVFGIESARAATIRHLNLGLHASQAAQARHLRIAGNDLQASLFTVCRHCGGVRGVRGQFNEPDDPNHHRGWCKVRSGARAPQWDTLALSHELVTEAVRVLLPVAEFEAAERVTSFKAALMLGLRDSFGGDPSHLRVIRSEFPAPGGPADAACNRFVVIHDTVPGGTGYLPRLADPERLRGILGRAVELISTCECQTRGKAGCHKCLYTAVARHEIPLVSRAVALAILDEILTNWGLHKPESGTITGINLAPVVQSELERMFKALLHRWAESGAARLTARPDPDDSRLTRFDVRFQDGPHWELREQVNLAAHHTRPDFYATRVDSPGTAPVAIYLDGWEFHGSVPDQVDLDAQRPASLRAGGTVVWALTWADIKAALHAANQHSTVGPVTPVGNAIRSAARTGARQLHGSDHPAFGALTQGAFGQLVSHLRHPDPLTWQHLVTALTLAPGPSGTHVPVGDRRATIDRLARGGQPEPSATPTGIDTITWETTGGLVVATLLDKDPAVPTVTGVASLDTTRDPDRDRWEDWTHLGNLLQFLGDAAILITTRTWSPEETPALTATPAAPPTPQPPGGPAAAELDDCYDDAARALAEAALAHGYTDLVVGYEPGDPDGTVLEVAWPARKVGILPTGATQPGALTGWAVRTPDLWEPADLLAALDEGAHP
ncbi:MAG: DEAD/DEAH box helicase [Actinomycetota bacterium]